MKNTLGSLPKIQDGYHHSTAVHGHEPDGTANDNDCHKPHLPSSPSKVGPNGLPRKFVSQAPTHNWKGGPSDGIMDSPNTSTQRPNHDFPSSPSQRRPGTPSGSTRNRGHIFQNVKFYIIESDELGHEEKQSLRTILCRNGAIDIESTRQSSLENTTNTTTTTANDTLTDLTGISHIISAGINFPAYEEAYKHLVCVVTPLWVRSSMDYKRAVPVRPFSPDSRFVFRQIHICGSDSLSPDEKSALYHCVRAMGGLCTDILTRLVTHVVTKDPYDNVSSMASGFNANTLAKYREDHQPGTAYNPPRGIKLILPNWVLDCMRHGRVLEESPYIYSEENFKAMNENLNSSNLTVTSSSGGQDSHHCSIFKNHAFYLGKDLNLMPYMKRSIHQLIESCEGRVVTSLEDATVYLGTYREGRAYILASRRGMNVGNLAWLYSMTANYAWSPPTQNLLHYPYVRGGHPDFHGLSITLTSISGDARYYLNTLIELLGANCTKEMTNKNSHVISGSPQSRKSKAAKSWGIQLMNHHWIEDSYANWSKQDENNVRYTQVGALTQGSTNLSEVVGRTFLNEEVLKQFYENVEISDSEEDMKEAGGEEEIIEDSFGNMIEDSYNQDQGGDFLSGQPPLTNVTENKYDDDNRQNSGDGTKDEEEDDGIFSTAPLTKSDKEAEVSVKDQKTISKEAVKKQKSKERDEPTSETKTTPEVESPVNKSPPRTPSTTTEQKPKVNKSATDSTEPEPLPRVQHSSRKAAQKAAEKLHHDMKELTYFQKQISSKPHAIPLLPEEVEQKLIDKKRKATKRMEDHKENSDDELSSSPSKKRTRKSSPPVEGHHSVYDISNLGSLKGSSFTPEEEEEQSDIPETEYKMKALITGVAGFKSAKKIKELEELGIKLVEDPNEVTHLFASKLCRTKKFLLSLAHGPLIMNIKFLNDCIKKKTFLIPEDYILKDPESEDSFGVTIEDVMLRSKMAKGKLFDGLVINITTDVPDYNKDIRDIIVGHGGSCHILYEAKNYQISSNGRFIVVATEKSKNIVESFVHNMKQLQLEDESVKGYNVYTREWILMAVVRMQFEFDNEFILRV